MKELTPLRSSIHLHTYASDGIGSISDICKAARQEGLDCIIITDHNTLGNNINGYAGNLLVITGEEITPRYQEQITETGAIKGVSTDNHILALGHDKCIGNVDCTPQEFINLIHEYGGMSFLAHPDEPGHPWVDWSVTGFTGLEIWTYKAAWIRGSIQSPSLTYAWRNPDSVLADPNKYEISAWDKMGRHRRIVGLGCTDNHNYVSSIEGVERTVFSWNVGLTGIVSYVLVEPDEFDRDPVRAFLDSIKKGRVIIAHDGLSIAKGFSIKAINRKVEETFWPGDYLKNWQGVRLEISSPKVASISVLKDGSVFYEKKAQHCEVQVDGPGVWRVEARLDGRPWIYSNPFYIGVWSYKEE
ncbi:MAG: PHP domain-containing protein [Desulfobacterales bacterium]|nr:PHP domain-containing protein [Desulfobacterales bacterium]